MPEYIKNILDKLINFWNSLEKKQKIKIISISSIVVIAIVVSFYVISIPNYNVTLMKNADPKQLKSVTDKLTENNIPYILSDDGNSIMIKSVDKSRSQVASLEFIDSGMSFDDAFNMIKLNTTESEKVELFKEYKKNNLSHKLMSIATNIEMADVELDMPKDSAFVIDSDQRKPTARVLLKVKGKLTQKQAHGVAAMVAGSVAGLSIKDVVVVDQDLNVLNSETDESGMLEIGSQEDMRSKKAKELEARIEKLLGGPSDSFDSLKVVANPFLDFDKSKAKNKEVTLPQGLESGSATGFILSSDVNSEKAVDSTVNQAPGTDVNPGTPNYPTNTTTGGTYNNGNQRYNYLYNQSETDSEKATGNIVPEKTTMAVALYYGRSVKDDAKLTPEFINAVIDNVSKASGVPAANISVNKFKMLPEVAQTTSISENAKKMINDFGVFALMTLLVLGLLIYAKPKKKKEEEAEVEPLGEDTELATAESLAEEGPKYMVPEAEAELPEIGIEERSEVKKQIEKFVKQKPDAVAQLLRNWISDDWD